MGSYLPNIIYAMPTTLSAHALPAAAATRALPYPLFLPRTTLSAGGTDLSFFFFAHTFMGSHLPFCLLDIAVRSPTSIRC